MLEFLPLFGWVVLTSFLFYFTSDLFVEAIQVTELLSITTSVLTYASISIAHKLTDLRNRSWKIAFMTIVVFTGQYIGKVNLVYIGLMFLNKQEDYGQATEGKLNMNAFFFILPRIMIRQDYTAHCHLDQLSIL